MTFPNALFVHIIRDGRDIALSLKKMGGFTPLPWDRNRIRTAWWRPPSTGSGWCVEAAPLAASFPADYVEIRYEDLITSPRETLGKLGSFIGHDLDYDRIQRAGLGRLSETNSSFREEGAKGDNQSARALETTPVARRYRGHRSDRGREPAGKWLRIVSAPRAPPGLAASR